MTTKKKQKTKLKNTIAKGVDPGVFHLVMDWWVAALVGTFIILLILSIPMVLWSDISPVQGGIATIILIAVILYIADLAFYSWYRIEDEGLVIGSQIRQIYFPYRYMQKISNGSALHLFSIAGRKRFALSRHNIIIRMRKGPWKIISLSPRKQQEFLDILLQKIEDERSRRVTIKSEQITK